MTKSMKNSNDPIEPVAFWLSVQCLSQPRKHVPWLVLWAY